MSLKRMRRERTIAVRQRESRGYRHRLKARTPMRMFAPGVQIDVELLRCVGRSLRLSFEAPDGVTIVREDLLGTIAAIGPAAASAPSARSIEFRPAGTPRQPGQRRLMLTIAVGEAVLLLGGGSSAALPSCAWQIRLVAERVGVVSGHLQIKAPECVRFEHGRPKAAG
jgi:sRNA-binding carbon storage regulator CsrA